ncbi:MAG: hypothetical protein GY696_36760 [Gammaproteobacteria bacterium]|nr:hypothetical protein [Gammaproteobacteria bacterium]
MVADYHRAYPHTFSYLAPLLQLALLQGFIFQAEEQNIKLADIGTDIAVAVTIEKHYNDQVVVTAIYLLTFA